jgi:hypothetical protein
MRSSGQDEWIVKITGTKFDSYFEVYLGGVIPERPRFHQRKGSREDRLSCTQDPSLRLNNGSAQDDKHCGIPGAGSDFLNGIQLKSKSLCLPFPTI